MTPAVEPTRGVSVLDLIGRTPLLRLRRFERELRGVELYAKAEWQNPGGSVKDRAAARIIDEGLRSGACAPGNVLLDATSGNTGIAYAMIGAARGFRVALCVPDNVTPERKRMLRAYGADLVLTDPLEGSDGAIREAQRRHAADPGRYFYADQYNNDANWRAHYDTTGPEILEQTEGRITHFVTGLGTTGTFTGVGRYLREYSRQRRAGTPIALVSVEPDSPLHGIEGLKHMATAIVPGIYDPALADETIEIATEDAYAMARRLATEEGLLVGPSSAANIVAALRVAGRIDSGVIVTMCCDGADRYLSEPFWDGPACSP